MRRVLTIAVSLAFFGSVVGFSAVAGAVDRCVKVAVPERGGEKSSIDPAVNVNQGDFMNVNALYEPIVQLDDNLTPQPWLAESWESNGDATEWTFHIRKGVKFHDGSPLTAADVVSTYRRVLDPVSGVAAKELTFIKPENVTAKDDYTVVFKPDSATVELPLLIANKFAYISKKGVTAEDLAKKSYGTGPFEIENFIPSDPTVTLKANPDYWRTGLPKAPCVEISAISEAFARTTALISGEIDVAATIDVTTLSMLQSNPDVTIDKSSQGLIVDLAMWTDTPPFDDARVRQAMKLVVDRQAMLDTVYLGYGYLGNDNPIPLNSTDAFRNDPIPQDIDKAKALLAEAGHPDGISVDLYTGDIIGGAVNFAQAYQQMAAKAGIKVNIIKSPADSYWDEIWLKKPFVTSYWGVRPAGTAFAIAYRGSAKYNETHWHNKDFDDLLDKASSTVDGKQRTELYKQAGALLSSDGGMIFPAFVGILSASRKTCSGFRPPADANRPDLSTVHCE